MNDPSNHSARKQDRREFLKSTGAVTAALLAPAAIAETPRKLPPLPSNPVMPSAIPTRNLGKTGYKVGIFSLGGQAALEKPNNFDVAVPIIERALDLGVNYIDTSSIYGGPDRWSEQYVGKVMAHRRDQAFLATKTKERTRDDSMRMIERSLQLLQTDHVDLWQLHDIGTMTDINDVFAKGGAMEALLEMKEQKVVRFLGLTGHYRPDALMEGIRRYPFDTILMAMNAADPHHYSFNDAAVAAGRRAPDGHHRHEDSGPRPPALHLDSAADRGAETHVGRHGVRRPRPARSPCAKPCTTRCRALSAPSSSAATPSRSSKRTCNSPAISRRSATRRLRRSWLAPNRLRSRHCSSASTTGPKGHETRRRENMEAGRPLQAFLH